MARLNLITDSDDELPELSTLLAFPQKIPCNFDSSKHKDWSTESRKRSTKSSQEGKGKVETSKQRPLKVAHVNSILLSLTDRGVLSSDTRRGPNAVARKYASALRYPSDSEYISSDHMSDFVVSDSDSDDSGGSSGDSTTRCLPSHTQYHFQNNDVRSSSRPSAHGRGDRSVKNRRKSSHDEDVEVRRNKSPARKEPRAHGRGDASSSVTGKINDSSDEPDSILKFSPPRLKSPSRSPPVHRAVTPPRSPGKLKLPSPKKMFGIPPSPHWPSMDAFWSQEVISDWNDQYSPKKTPKVSRTKESKAPDEDDEGYFSPCQIQKRSPSKSPVKKDKQVAERRKAFNEKKYDLAASFLKELDQKIMSGQIADLTEPTGGVRLVWSKKLQSTAGRANWKREAVRSKDGESKVMATQYRHHASIELAEKVIDNEDRLINVIAHEYCHLLNFMISNIKDNPHGKEFKAWAKKCSTAFAHRGVNVTTTHVYEISYKYIWACNKCETEYKRHSKSIDPARHSCGKCHEKLVQIKPVPRGEGKGMSEYQRFVKENFARLKRERPEMSMGEVMTALGKEFRAAKEKQNSEVTSLEDDVVEVEGWSRGEDAGLDSVVRKLDFLNLEMS